MKMRRRKTSRDRQLAQTAVVNIRWVEVDAEGSEMMQAFLARPVLVERALRRCLKELQ